MIYSQFLRYKRICTRSTNFIENSNELTTHLLHKAYHIKVITKQWNKVTIIPRTELLMQKQHTSTNCLSLAHAYHPTIVPTNIAVVKEWKRYSNMPAEKIFSAAKLSAHKYNRPTLSKFSSRQESPLHQPLPVTKNAWNIDAKFAT